MNRVLGHEYMRCVYEFAIQMAGTVGRLLRFAFENATNDCRMAIASNTNDSSTAATAPTPPANQNNNSNINNGSGAYINFEGVYTPLYCIRHLDRVFVLDASSVLNCSERMCVCVSHYLFSIAFSIYGQFGQFTIY